MRAASCLPFLLPVLAGFAAEPLMTTDQLTALLARYPGIPGVGVCIVDRDQTTTLVAGVRKAGTDNALTRDDLFHIGSCTKFMTACLVEIAVREGKVRWDSRLGELLPADQRPTGPLADVTLDELIQCRSGLPEDREPSAWPAGVFPRLYPLRDEPEKARALLADAAVRTFTDISRDGAHRYSNLGYTLAGHVLELASGEPFERLMEEKLFRPLGLASAGFGAPVWVDPERQPWGHVDGRPTTADAFADNPTALAPAGTVRMTLGDMGRYLRFVMSGGGPLAAAAVTALRTGTVDEFHRGWLSHERGWAKGRIWMATGSNTQFLTLFLVAPAVEFAVAVSINAAGDDAGKLLNEVTNTLAQAFIDREKRR